MLLLAAPGGYDGSGNQTSIDYPDGTGVDYAYDLLGQLKTVTEEDGRTTTYTYDGMGRVVKMEYPHGWVEDYVYDSIGQLLRVDDTDPTQKDLKQQKHVYKYDDCGNMIYEYMRGNGTGEATTENTYTYDALHRITRADEVYGKAWREYQYDSLGNLTYEHNSNNVHYDYKLNNLNQITQKTYSSNDKEGTLYTYDGRGNLVLEQYGKLNGNGNGNGNGQRSTVGEYTYDETNKMVLGVNSSGESSAYLYNGLGALVEDTWKIAKNGYGYHDVDAGLGDADPNNGRGGGGSNGNGNGNGNGQGNGNGSGDKPTGSLVTNFSTVVKQFVVDYTSPTFEPLMEHEVNGLDYRYVYGNDRLSVNITGVETSSGNLIENGNQIRLYYHMDYLGTTDYLTSPVSLKVTSWTHYNEWGEITHNAVLKSGKRELDLVKRYATHDYDAVLGMYYAKARFYDAENRRFAAIDSEKDGDNWYIYCGDNPINYLDPTGHFFIADDAAIAVVLFTGAVVVMTYAYLQTPAGKEMIHNGAVAIYQGTVIAGKAISQVTSKIANVVQSGLAWGGEKIVGGINYVTQAVTDIGQYFTNLFCSKTIQVESTKDKILSDVKARRPSGKVYQLAYVDKSGNLIRLPGRMDYFEALAALGVTGIANAKRNPAQRYRYDSGKGSPAQRQLQPRGQWGIYTNSQAAAKALAVAFQGYKAPEVHGSGKYGHYHDGSHSFHIWFGGVKRYY